MEKCNISNCDIYGAIKLIKSRYSSVIMFRISDNSVTFTQLINEFTYLSANQLTRSLKELEENNLISHTNKEYKLTSSGIELLPILRDLETWYYKNQIKTQSYD